jgi:peptidoglycan/LPS O-acetylase OafA/YrhL
MSGSTPSIRHMPALNGLRGAAVAGVLLFHGAHLTGGFLGVDLFFVLSGFLITSLLLVEHDQNGSIALGRFWARRARRLLPALGLVLLGVAAYAAWMAEPAALARIRGDGTATLLYVANWRAVFAPLTYWELFTEPSPLSHTWSLAIEEQFYVVWPLVVVGLHYLCRRGRHRDAHVRAARAVLVLSVALAVASFVAMQFVYDAASTNRAYYGTDTRAVGILVGAALSAGLKLWGPTRTAAGRRWLDISAIVGVVTLAVAWTHIDGQDAALYHGGFTICALAAAAVIASVSQPRPGWLAAALSWRPLAALGLISYGVYLWHWPVYVALDGARTGLGGWSLLGARVAVTLAIASASYFAVELPIRQRRFTLPRPSALVPALAAGVAVALFAATGGWSIRGSTTASTEVAALAAESYRPPPTVLAAQQLLVASGAALLTSDTPAAVPTDVPRRLLVLGSSVGYLLADGFAQIEADPPLTVVNGARPACHFPSGVTGSRDGHGQKSRIPVFDCTDRWADYLDTVRPDVVLVIFGAFGDGTIEHDGQWLHPCLPAYDDWYRDSLRETVKMIAAHGARATLATAAYTMLPGLSDVHWSYADCVNAITREVADESRDADLIDLAAFICPTHACHISLDGIELRKDGVHYRDDSARFVAAWMLPQLRAPRAMR